MKYFSFTAIVLSLLILINSCKTHVENQIINDSNKDGYCVACYYFPNYHQDPRTVRKYGYGWTGWELVKNARPRFEGHQQPKIPLWDYTDDSNPLHMEQKIDAAADHGVDVFIFDWYYNNDGPFLQGAIEQGFFKAGNRGRMKFALMWVNQDWVDLYSTDNESVLQDEEEEVFFRGAINSETWDEMTDYIINNYFKHSAYWTIDDIPYFSVYNLSKFLQSFGSIDKAKAAIESFRNKARKAGFRDIHLNVVQWGNNILPSGKGVSNHKWMELIDELGFTSTTSYSWAHHAEPDVPVQSYNELKEEYFTFAEQSVSDNALPYFPNITMGWDCSPRANQDEEYVVIESTPEKFRLALKDMKLFLDMHPSCNNTFIIHCWNEWTEGSYLEPDTINKMAYLEALGMVF